MTIGQAARRLRRRSLLRGGRLAMALQVVSAVVLLAGCAQPVVGSPQPTSAGPAVTAGSAPGGASGQQPGGVTSPRAFPQPSGGSGSSGQPGGGGGLPGGGQPDGGGGGVPGGGGGGLPGGGGGGGLPGGGGGLPGGGGGGDAGGAGGQVAPTTPPAWVKPDLRITFYLSSSQSGDDTTVRVEDPNGDWTDPATGKKYRSVTVRGDGTGTSAGDGYVQYDIRTISGGSLAVTVRQYGIDHLNNYLSPAGSRPVVSQGPNLDGVWIHPDELAKLAKSASPGTTVTDAPWDLNGTKYQALRVETTGPNNHSLAVYDKETGVLLALSTKNVATSPAQPGQIPTGANTQLGNWEFRGTRYMTLVGSGGTNPSWVAQQKQLNYSGTDTFINPGDAHANVLQFPMNQTVTFKPALGNLFEYASETVIQMQTPVRGSGSGFAGPYGPYWIDPAALPPLRAGQVIDKDPITGESTTVAAVDAGSVTIQTTAPGLEVTAVYDKSSGALTYTRLRNAGTGITDEMQLTQ